MPHKSRSQLEKRLRKARGKLTLVVERIGKLEVSKQQIASEVESLESAIKCFDGGRPIYSTNPDSINTRAEILISSTPMRTWTSDDVAAELEIRKERGASVLAFLCRAKRIRRLDRGVYGACVEGESAVKVPGQMKNNMTNVQRMNALIDLLDWDSETKWSIEDLMQSSLFENWNQAHRICRSACKQRKIKRIRPCVYTSVNHSGYEKLSEVQRERFLKMKL